MKYKFSDGVKEFFVFTIKNPCKKVDFPNRVNKNYFCDGDKINDNFKLSHQLSLVKGYDRTKDLPLINMPPVTTKNEISYTNKKLNHLKIALQSGKIQRGDLVLLIG